MDAWQRTETDPVHVTWSPRQPAAIGALAGDGVTLWIGPVSRPQLEAARRMVDEALIEARLWIEDALSSGDAWQSSMHERRWRLEPDGSVTVHDDDGLHILDRERR